MDNFIHFIIDLIAICQSFINVLFWFDALKCNVLGVENYDLQVKPFRFYFIPKMAFTNKIGFLVNCHGNWVK